MRKSSIIGGTAVAIFIGGLVGFVLAVPKSGVPPQTVTKDSSIVYKVGEKVMANPYGSWEPGKIIGVISEDEYIVNVCGPFGWNGNEECNDLQLRRSRLAKTE